MTRVLLPISFVAAIVLVALGVTMSLRAGVDVTGVDGQQATIALAPTASQEAIKELGTNGGGIFNANSAHPFENPNALDQPAGDLPAAGHPGLPDPRVRRAGRRPPAGPRAARGDGRALGRPAGRRLVGRDAPERPGRAWPPAPRWRARRSGSASRPRCCSRCPPPAPRPARSTRCTTATPAWAAGSSLLNMLLGEVAPGGVGAGLYGILVLAVIAVFLAGLMVGRTPEYLGKKLGRRRGDRRGDLAAGHADGGAARRRRRAGPAGRAVHRAGQLRRARAVRGALRLRLGRQQQRQRVRRAHRDQPVLPVHAGAGHAVRPVRADPGRARAGRLAGRADAGSSPAPARCPPPARCSGCWSAAPSCSSPR